MGKKHRKHQSNPSPPQQQSLQGINSQKQPIGAQVQLSHYEGPLPHPSILHGYNQVVPGAAERIIFMAEQQTKHRQELEKAAITSEIKDSRLGLFLGFVIGIVAIISGAVCIVQGHSIAGGVLGGSAVPGLTAVFVYGSRQRRKERETKFKQMTEKDKK